MAKFVAVYVLDNQGVSGLFDPNQKDEVKKPLLHNIYITLETNADIASGKLYAPELQNPPIPFLPDDLEAKIKAYGNGGGTTPHPAPVPKVLASEISTTHHNQITVIFDKDMTTEGDVKSQLNIIVDGGTPIHPTAVDTQTRKTVIMTFSKDFTHDNVVSWAYDDQGAGVLRSKEGTEADNQTYAVHNKVPIATPPPPPPADDADDCEKDTKKKTKKK